MDNTLITALQKQFNRERFNSQQYHALSTGLAALYWDGASNYMGNNAKEEMNHADRFAEYMIDRNIVPVYDALEVPIAVTNAIYSQFFQTAYELEQTTTETIKELFYLCETNEDPQTEQFLMWFLEEQTKSERELMDHLTMIRRLDGNGLLLFDNSLK